MRATPLSPACGCRIEGIDLREPLTPVLVDEIKALWRKHLVLVFNQPDLSTEEQIRFSQYFGKLVEHPMTMAAPQRKTGPASIDRAVLPITHHARNDVWHADITFMEVPPSLSFLYGVSPIGDERDETHFANCYMAHNALSSGLRHWLSSVKAVHTGRHLLEVGKKLDYSGKERAKTGQDQGNFTTNEDDIQIALDMLHPCIRKHPETGKASLYVNVGFADRFDGWTAEESRPVMKMLIDIATNDDFVYKHRWCKSDLVCWDNRAVMHYGVHNYDSSLHKRYMVRTAVTPSAESRPHDLNGEAPTHAPQGQTGPGDAKRFNSKL